MNTASNETIAELLSEAHLLEEKSNTLNWNAEVFWRANVLPDGYLMPNDYEEYQRICNEADELVQQAMTLYNRIRAMRGLPKLPAEPVDDDDMPCMVDLGCDHCDACESVAEESRETADRLEAEARELLRAAEAKDIEAASYFDEHLDACDGDYRECEREHDLWIAMTRTVDRLEALARAKRVEADRLRLTRTTDKDARPCQS